MKFNLTRPLVFLDLETTGLNVGKDKIVEISLLKIMPNGEEISRTELINPGCHIPEECSDIHGITDEDVRDKPTFEQLADDLAAFIGDADLAGFNSNKFDVPLLVEEFLRCGRRFDLRNRYLIDVQNIFHKMEPRNLVAAYKFYCGGDLTDAHQASADTKATYEVLKAQLEKYDGVEYTDRHSKRTYVPVQNDHAETLLLGLCAKRCESVECVHHGAPDSRFGRPYRDGCSAKTGVQLRQAQEPPCERRF